MTINLCNTSSLSLSLSCTAGKVFMKLGFEVPDALLHDVVASKPGVIEYILNHFKKKVQNKALQQIQTNIPKNTKINDTLKCNRWSK